MATPDRNARTIPTITLCAILLLCCVAVVCIITFSFDQLLHRPMQLWRHLNLFCRSTTYLRRAYDFRTCPTNVEVAADTANDSGRNAEDLQDGGRLGRPADVMAQLSTFFPNFQPVIPETSACSRGQTVEMSAVDDPLLPVRQSKPARLLLFDNGHSLR